MRSPTAMKIRILCACICALLQLGSASLFSPVAAAIFDYEGRIEANQRIIQQDPGSTEAEEAYLMWGDLASGAHLGRYSEAVSAYEGLLERFPQSKYAEEVTFYLAYLNHYYLYDYKKALLYYDLILKKYTHLEFVRSDYYKNVSFISLTIEDVRQAVARIQHLIQMANEHERISTAVTKEQIVSVTDRLATLYRREKNFDKSIELYNYIAENAEDNDSIQSAIFNVGDIYLTSIPDFKREYYNRTIYTQGKVDSSLVRGISTMRVIVDRFPRGTLASRALLEIAEAYMSMSVDWVTQGSAEVEYFLMGDYARAEQTLMVIIKDYPTSEIMDEALYRLGQVYESEQTDKYSNRTHGMRRFKDAVEIYQRLVREYPSSVYTDRAKERISTLRSR